MKQKKNGFRKGKKRNMKRVLCLTAAVLFAIGLIGCDGRGNGNEGYRNGRGYRDKQATYKYRFSVEANLAGGEKSRIG